MLSEYPEITIGDDILREATLYARKQMVEIDLLTRQMNKITAATQSDDKDAYYVSQQLIFLLKLYRGTGDAMIRQQVVDFIDTCALTIKNKNHMAFMGLAEVCAELYADIPEQKYISLTLSFILFEESLYIPDIGTEMICIKNTFALLQLLKYSAYQGLLIQINRQTNKLLHAASFEKGGIYWSFLYRLLPDKRALYESLLKLLFLKLYNTTGNDTFIYIVDHAVSRSGRRYFKQGIPFQGNLKRDSSKLYEQQTALIDIAWQLHRIKIAFGVVDQQSIAELVKPLWEKYFAQYEFNVAEGIICHYLYELTGEAIYDQQAIQRFHFIKKHYINYSSQTFNHLDFFKRQILIFWLDMTLANTRIDSHTLPLNNDVVKLYPALSISKPGVKRVILSARFNRVLILLSEALPNLVRDYLNQPLTPGNEDETTTFLELVKANLNTSYLQKKYLLPILRLESTGHNFLRRYQHIPYCYTRNDITKHITLMNSEEIYMLRLYVFGEIKAINIQLNPALKTYCFTFGHYFVYSGSNLILCWYDPVHHKIAEATIDEYDLLILDLFKNHRLVSEVTDIVLTFIDHQPEQIDEARRSILARIKNMIKENILITYPEKI